jgi:hypothetical protein
MGFDLAVRRKCLFLAESGMAAFGSPQTEADINGRLSTRTKHLACAVGSQYRG